MGEAEDSGSGARSAAAGVPGGGTGQSRHTLARACALAQNPSERCYLFRKSATPFLTYWANKPQRAPRSLKPGVLMHCKRVTSSSVQSQVAVM